MATTLMHHAPAALTSSARASGGVAQQREPSHTPVLLERAVECLHLRAGGVYVDGTFGGGGHSRRILDDPVRVSKVVAVDADLAAEDRAGLLREAPAVADRLAFAHGNFRDLGVIVRAAGHDRVDGVLLDLGVSSFQVDEGERGFSFRHDAPLDMRFDTSRGRPASDIVNTASRDELVRLLWLYGEEPQARRIASALVRERERAPLLGTGQVAAIVEAAVGGRRGRPIHPATRTFQALRIAVNDELDALREVLPAAVDLLAPGGRLVIIAFHSLEDRIVKRAIEAESARCVCPPEQPVCTCAHVPRVRRVGKPVRADAAEVAANPRSRSAIMRVAERLDDAGEVVP